MATTISTQDILSAKRDIEDIGKAVNEKVIVSPRYGEDFKSLPMIAAEAQDAISEWESAIALITQEGGVPALAVSDASGKTQQEVNDLTGAPYRVKVGGYNIGERVILESGDIVKSTVSGNTVDPNVDMTGWVLVNSPDQIPYKFGSQLSFNERFVFPQDFGAVLNGKLSSRYTTLTAAKFAYANIADQITSLDQSLFWAGLQSAIVSLHSKGGGEVVITPGSWLLSDPVVGRANVTVSGRGDSSLVDVELNNRWAGRYIFDGRGHSNFVIKNFKIDQNGRYRTASQWTGSALVINKSEFSGAENVTFYDASDMTSQSSTPHILIIAKDVEDDASDFEAMVGSVNYGFIRKCRFIIPDENTRCGFAIRVMTDFTKQRPRDSFIHTIQNCDISGNSFNGDYFWNMIELAGGGTRLNTINYNSAKGKTLTFVDFDKGCNLNSARGNIALDITYPPNLANSNTVRMAIFADHGSDGYLNYGNKFIENICKRATGRTLASYNEGALYIQNVESTEFTSNTVDGFNDGTVGAGLVIANNSSNLTISKNDLKDVFYGVSSIASVNNARSWKFLENEIEAANNCFTLSAAAGSKIRGLKISGGSLKSLANNVLVVSVPGLSRFASLYIGDGIQISGGLDQISAGADVNIIDGAFMYGAEGRSIRLTGGQTTISNSTSENPKLGDLIVQSGVREPTLNGNSFTYGARATPISTYMSEIPTAGTWINGDRVNNITPPASGYMGWVCIISGTFGSLASVSATTTEGSPTITVSSSANLKVGDYIAIAGFSGGSRIISISGNNVTLSRSVTVSLSGAAVSFSSPQFKGFGLIEA